jgi:hypothetical protein
MLLRKPFKAVAYVRKVFVHHVEGYGILIDHCANVTAWNCSFQV